MSGILSSPTLNMPHLTIETSPSHSELKVRVGRTRSSSLVKVETVGEDNQEEGLDQSLYENMNAEWVNRKGAWVIHPLLIIAGKIVVDTIPGMQQELSWTLVNLIYLGFHYLMFHWVTGIPFQSDLHSGAYDDLTLWEQIDEGAHYTPAKKWLFTVPIVLFLASTHYTNYNPWNFAINLTALILVLIPKLPQLHRQRVRFMVDDEPSGMSTPVTPGFPNRSGSTTPNLLDDSIPPIKITPASIQ
ncbi:Orm1 type endoplasmic reticulum protein [Irpex rosettiformis]|uniref:Orm1 type endoplasmic reticulum protein n=1 Tax=Irpex rosettiformis TaxID=378272 RepID=A0ACB8U4N5_9APHY|nr:Orm1 type endoplasmic reticulum protein [Irpex rosettiformis]